MKEMLTPDHLRNLGEANFGLEAAKGLAKKAAEEESNMPPAEKKKKSDARKAAREAERKQAELDAMDEVQRSLHDIGEMGKEDIASDIKKAEARKAEAARKKAEQEEAKRKAEIEAKKQADKERAARKMEQLKAEQAEIDSARAELKTTKENIESAREEMRKSREKKRAASIADAEALLGLIDEAKSATRPAEFPELPEGVEVVGWEDDDIETGPPEGMEVTMTDEEMARRTAEAAEGQGEIDSARAEIDKTQLEEEWFKKGERKSGAARPKRAEARFTEKEEEWFKKGQEESKQAEAMTEGVESGRIKEEYLPTEEGADVIKERVETVDQKLIPTAEEMEGLKRELADLRDEATRLEQEWRGAYDKMGAANKTRADRGSSFLGKLSLGMRGLFNKDVRDYSQAWDKWLKAMDRIDELEAATEKPKQMTDKEREEYMANRASRALARRMGAGGIKPPSSLGR